MFWYVLTDRPAMASELPELGNIDNDSGYGTSSSPASSLAAESELITSRRAEGNSSLDQQVKAHRDEADDTSLGQSLEAELFGESDDDTLDQELWACFPEESDDASLEQALENELFGIESSSAAALSTAPAHRKSEVLADDSLEGLAPANFRSACGPTLPVAPSSGLALPAREAASPRAGSSKPSPPAVRPATPFHRESEASGSNGSERQERRRPLPPIAIRRVGGLTLPTGAPPVFAPAPESASSPTTSGNPSPSAALPTTPSSRPAAPAATPAAPRPSAKAQSKKRAHEEPEGATPSKAPKQAKRAAVETIDTRRGKRVGGGGRGAQPTVEDLSVNFHSSSIRAAAEKRAKKAEKMRQWRAGKCNATFCEDAQLRATMQNIDWTYQKVAPEPSSMTFKERCLRAKSGHLSFLKPTKIVPVVLGQPRAPGSMPVVGVPMTTDAVDLTGDDGVTGNDCQKDAATDQPEDEMDSREEGEDEEDDEDMAWENVTST